MTKPVPMTALRSLTYSQSPTGAPLDRAAAFDAPDAATADDLERRGAAKRAVKSATAKAETANK